MLNIISQEGNPNLNHNEKKPLQCRSTFDSTVNDTMSEVIINPVSPDPDPITSQGQCCARGPGNRVLISVSQTESFVMMG